MTRRWVGMFGGLASLAIGCKPAGEAPLVIASAWPRPVRDDLVSAYRREQGSTRPIAWVDLAPEDRPGDALARRGGVDLVLGGSPLAFARMAEFGLLDAPWQSIQRPEAGPPQPDGPPPDGGRLPVAFADPRDDSATFELVASLLRGGDWATTYADLIRRAARGRPVIGAVADGRSALGPPGSSPIRIRREGVAPIKGGRSRDEAGRFLAFLSESHRVRPIEGEVTAVDGLLADLLGATLVDAHEEMRAAAIALDRQGHPDRAESPFVEAPPWPPASVVKLQTGPDGAALLGTLAEQVAPDPDVRSWLLDSWGRPSRPIDGAILGEISAARGGRLAREPRFRAWLRAEWTAWARQRYRRVARVASGWVPS